eukprot:7911559-Pyramimonas_sp.AAC.1
MTCHRGLTGNDARCLCGLCGAYVAASTLTFATLDISSFADSAYSSAFDASLADELAAAAGVLNTAVTVVSVVPGS